MASDAQIAENFYERGANAARWGYPLTDEDQFRSEGHDPFGYRFFKRGYEETFAAMTPSERQAAALRERA